MALLSLSPEYTCWPDDANERRKFSANFYRKHGLRHCVGVVDGTPVMFTRGPFVDGETFYDRKGRYSINLLDVLLQSPIAINPADYFSDMQCIIANAEYGAKWWLCTPSRWSSDADGNHLRLRVESDILVEMVQLLN